MCDNDCSGHGVCKMNINCECYQTLAGHDAWTGPDCSRRTCPKGIAWVGNVINANDLHPLVECSNQGYCNRIDGNCYCYSGYEGIACQRTHCPEDCNDRGKCWPEKLLAASAGRTYTTPWDSKKHVGCVCDIGYRGPSCGETECPSGEDPLGGLGHEASRDCSGRGICDTVKGICKCFPGFYGELCQEQAVLQ